MQVLSHACMHIICTHRNKYSQLQYHWCAATHLTAWLLDCITIDCIAKQWIMIATNNRLQKCQLASYRLALHNCAYIGKVAAQTVKHQGDIYSVICESIFSPFYILVMSLHILQVLQHQMSGRAVYMHGFNSLYYSMCVDNTQENYLKNQPFQVHLLCETLSVFDPW